MKPEELFAAALGIQSPWYITSINLEIEKGELNIEIDFPSGSEFEYVDQETGEIERYKAYDTSLKTWRHMNFFQYRCYLNAWIPRVKIKSGKVKQVKAPWEGNTSGFTLLFEAFVIQLCKVMTVHQVCGMIGSYDSKIWGILHTYTDQCRQHADYSNVEDVGIDETAARRGHDYVTLFVDLDQKKTIFVTEGKSNEAVKAFAKDLKEHKGDAKNIKNVSCDMSPAFIKGITENFPNAEIVFDKFHIIKLINEAVDQVRKQEVKKNPILKDTKYVFLKNQENFTKKQNEKYEQIRLSKLNIKTFKAMRIRESFQQLYLCQNKEMFESLLSKWYWWATHSRIPEIMQVAKTIKTHWTGVVNWAKKQLTNAILEGLNSIFQAAKAKARGYKKIETIKTIIYVLTGKLDFSIVNPFCTTHTLL